MTPARRTGLVRRKRRGEPDRRGHGKVKFLPSEVAKKSGRHYVTPEDVDEAFKSGSEIVDVWHDVLSAISKKSVEDVSLVAFVAIHGYRKAP